MQTRPEHGTGWFPKLNSRGEVASSGLNEVWVAGRYVGAGGATAWVTDDIVAYLTDGGIHLITPQGAAIKTIPGVWNWIAGGGGRLIAARPNVVTNFNAAFDISGETEGGGVRASANGRLAYYTDYKGQQNVLMVDGKPSSPAVPIMWTAVSERHVAWVKAISVYGREAYVDGALVSVDDTEGWIWLFDDWVMTQYKGGFRIRPIGSDQGYLWLTGNADNPDVRMINGKIVIAASTTRGELLSHVIDPESPRVNIRTTPVVVAPPPPPPPPVPQPKPEPVPVSIPNRLDVVKRVSAEHPNLIAQNTPATIRELYWRIGYALHEADAKFGFLSKSQGENGQEVAGVRTAVDAFAYQGSDQTVDVFTSAGDGPGKGGLSWGLSNRRPSNVWIKPVPYPGESVEPEQPAPPPVVTQPAPVDNAPLLARLAQLEAAIVPLGSALAHLAGQVEILEGSALKAGHPVTVSGSTSRSLGHSHTVTLTGRL